AGFLYLLLAHLGAIGVLLCFGVMQGAGGIAGGGYTFAAMRAKPLDPFWASVVFLLALFGFGAKAGMLPLHAWLPEAHPAARSPDCRRSTDSFPNGCCCRRSLQRPDCRARTCRCWCRSALQHSSSRRHCRAT